MKKSPLTIYSQWAQSLDWPTAAINLLLGTRERIRLFQDLSSDLILGPLLEIGVGTGANLPYYPREQIQAYAIDMTPAMLARAQNKANGLKISVDFREMNAIHLDFPDDYFGRIVGSCVFCAVEDQVAAFAELRRVLHPRGQIRLLEHVQPPGPILGMFAEQFDGYWRGHFGCHLNCKTVENLMAAGLTVRLELPLRCGVFRYLEITKD